MPDEPNLLDDFVQEPRTAYFSMEIALRPEIHTYAGGLGILAGDTTIANNYENGVTRDLTMDYGDFVLSGKLADLEVFTAEECK